MNKPVFQTLPPLFSTGLPHGNLHYVQGSDWEECVCQRLDGHEYDAEQVREPVVILEACDLACAGLLYICQVQPCFKPGTSEEGLSLPDPGVCAWKLPFSRLPISPCLLSLLAWVSVLILISIGHRLCMPSPWLHVSPSS